MKACNFQHANQARRNQNSLNVWQRAKLAKLSCSGPVCSRLHAGCAVAATDPVAEGAPSNTSRE